MTEQREPGQVPETEGGQDSGHRWSTEGPGVAVAPQRTPGQPMSPSRAVGEPTWQAAPVPEATPVPTPAPSAPSWEEPTATVAPTRAQPPRSAATPSVDWPAWTVGRQNAARLPKSSPTPPLPNSAAEPSRAEPEAAAPVSLADEVEATTVAPEQPEAWLPAPEATPPVSEPDPTQALAALPPAAIYRDVATPADAVEQASDEAEKLAAERAARKEARMAALTATAPVVVAAPEPVVVHRRSNDLWAGSLGLFVLRLVVAAIFAIRGVNLLGNLPAGQELFGQTAIPYPQYAPLVTGIASLLIALSLLLGLLTRVAGVGVLLITVGALVFVQWGSFQIFTSPVALAGSAFLGELELLLAAVGLLFLLVGAGGWSFDRTFRAARAKTKAAKQAAKAAQAQAN